MLIMKYLLKLMPNLKLKVNLPLLFFCIIFKISYLIFPYQVRTKSVVLEK